MPQIDIQINTEAPGALQDKPVKAKKKAKLSAEDQAIVAALVLLREELDNLHNRFDNVVEPLLVDSLAYEIQAVQLRHMYYLNLCKERGIISGGFDV